MSLRVLVVSENQVLMRNLRAWFKNKVEAGDLIIDHATSREQAEHLMYENAYDKIFHNGIFIIDAIERLQQGSEVYFYGHSNNSIYKNEINVDNRKAFSKIFYRKVLQSGVNIGGVLGGLTLLTGLIAFAMNLRTDVNVNLRDVAEIKSRIEHIEVDQKEIANNMEKLVTTFEIVYKDEVGDIFKNEKK